VIARAAIALGVAAALAAVFLAYLDPHLARDLSARFWACF
jgi:hypothetical protein